MNCNNESPLKINKMKGNSLKEIKRYSENFRCKDGDGELTKKKVTHKMRNRRESKKHKVLQEQKSSEVSPLTRRG